MRNVTTICVCLPADMAESVKANAQRLGISTSSYIKMRLAQADEVDAERYRVAKTHLSSVYGMIVGEVNDNGGENQS